MAEAVKFARIALWVDGTVKAVCREHAGQLRLRADHEESLHTRGSSCEVCRNAYDRLLRESGR